MAARPAPTTAAAAITGERIVVDAPAYGATTATLTGWSRVNGTWRRTWGPWTAWVGRHGVAPPGAKREGDGRTPSGTYGFSFFFGVHSDPGVRYEYRHITSHSIVWDDDPASPRYNEWSDTRHDAAGANPEPMYNTPSYDYGAVIAYNSARTPGLGSAIFLHVSHSSPTAGCVAVPTSELLDLLRWLDPRFAPMITIGVGAT